MMVPLTGPKVPDLNELVRPDRAAVIVIDVQMHFIGADLSADLAGFIDHLEALIAAARSAGVRCIFVRAVETDAGNTDVWVSRHAGKPHRLGNVEGGPGSAFHPRITPAPGEAVFTKSRYSAFLGTALEDVLRGEGIDTVILTGLQSDVCVRFTGAEAFQRDFWTITVADATTTRSSEDHDRAMTEAATHWGIVATADDVISAWQATSVAGPTTATRR
jgi:nicotinamidase-related amidase